MSEEAKPTEVGTQVIGLTGWLEIIKGVLAFPDAILRVVRLFQNTPQEDHAATVDRIAKESDSFSKTGRPK